MHVSSQSYYLFLSWVNVGILENAALMWLPSFVLCFLGFLQFEGELHFNVFVDQFAMLLQSL